MLITYQPIGIFHSSHQETYEAPRQGVLAGESRGWFELGDDFNVDAVEDLWGFERIWLVYDFHQNKTWKPKVRPPRFSEKKRSVFSTRSPYRPNSIGLSCVKLEKIEGKKIFVSEHDILDGSPILDIKPYLPYADSFSEVQTGWVASTKGFKVDFEDDALEKILWLEDRIQISFRQILSNQLSYEPTNTKAKRVKVSGEHFVFAIRTWRFLFRVEGEQVSIFDVTSGYTDLEMKSTQDPYQDKKLHLDFLIKFNR